MSENKEVLPQLPDIVGRTNWLPFRKAGKLIFLSGICGIKDDGSTCDDPKEQIKIHPVYFVQLRYFFLIHRL